MSQSPVTFKEQIAVERSSLDSLSSEQIEIRYQIRTQRTCLTSHMDEIAILNGFAGIDDAAFRHLGVSVSAEMRKKSLAFSCWRDTCLGVAGLHFSKMLTTGVVEDYDVLLAACPAFDEA